MAEPQTRARGAGGWYVVAVMATAISIDTSWRFFEHVLGITWFVERLLMFAVVEAALIACGWAMRANVRRPGGDGKPGGVYQAVAWSLCGASAYMAIALSGPLQGIARVALGPVLAIVALHLALGIEVRTHHAGRSGTWARVGRELRERFLSRFGLADDSRDALARTRDRATARAARLATSGWFFRGTRLARAVRACGATSDAEQRARLVEQIATLQHLGALSKTVFPSPWDTSSEHTEGTVPDAPPSTPQARPGRSARNTHGRSRSTPQRGHKHAAKHAPTDPVEHVRRLAEERGGTVPIRVVKEQLKVGTDGAKRLLIQAGVLDASTPGSTSQVNGREPQLATSGA